MNCCKSWIVAEQSHDYLKTILWGIDFLEALKLKHPLTKQPRVQEEMKARHASLKWSSKLSMIPAAEAVSIIFSLQFVWLTGQECYLCVSLAENLEKEMVGSKDQWDCTHAEDWPQRGHTLTTYQLTATRGRTGICTKFASLGMTRPGDI